ncbi:uncharacterized protein LOC134825384 [Bolinopsis microptera]|uniref:uncharacterized protein LOC134825384 n=1 Tax=Bolinopsis microptera TaxID=2820187 RepID=UPI00307961E8
MVYSDSAKNKSETAKTTFENILYLLKGYFPGEMMTLCRKDFRSINQLRAQYSKVEEMREKLGDLSCSPLKRKREDTGNYDIRPHTLRSTSTMTEDQSAQPQPLQQEDLLLTISRLLKLERKSMVSKLQPSILRGAKSGDIFPGSTYNHRRILATSPLDITKDVQTKNCDIIYTFLRNLMDKPDDTEDGVNHRIGIAVSVIMNLTNQQLNIYADKLGVMMIAAGLPNSALDIVGTMGITCGSQTGREIIKDAAKDSKSLILKAVEFSGTKHNTEEIIKFLEKLAKEPYLFIGRSKMSHQIIYNATGGVSIAYECDAELLANVDNPLSPAVDIVGDNFNRNIGNERWGKSVPIDVFHIAGILRQVRALPTLSWTKPEIPLEKLEVSHLCPSTTDLNQFSLDSEYLFMIVLVNRDDDLSDCKEWIDTHLHHPLREVMDQATVTVPLGIIPENQTSTAANVKILMECEQYMNKSNVII